MNKTFSTKRRVELNSKTGERGFVLVACMVCAVVLFGMAGLAIDLGRMYITKNEAQSFADSAALYAAQQLDGTTTGLTNADYVVNHNSNAWNFGTTAFTGSITEYSADGTTNWQTSDKIGGVSAVNIRYVRVTPVVNNMALFFLPVTSSHLELRHRPGQIFGQLGHFFHGASSRIRRLLGRHRTAGEVFDRRADRFRIHRLPMWTPPAVRSCQPPVILSDSLRASSTTSNGQPARRPGHWAIMGFRAPGITTG